MNRGGWVIFDVVAGLVLVAALSAVLALVATASSRSMARQADEREALRLAEAGAIAARAGEPLPAQVKLVDLQTAADGRWVEIIAGHDQAQARLVVFVPGGQP